MYLLDTDHLSVLVRGGIESERLRRRLQTVSPDDVAATIVSYEEQTRGWLGFIAKTNKLDEQLIGYQYLQRHLQMFCAIPLFAFDDEAALLVRRFQQQRIRVGTMDMKIACIALVHEAILLSRNTKDFQKIPGLQVEDWTILP